MEDPRSSITNSSSSSSRTPSPPPLPPSILVKPSTKKKHGGKPFRIFRSVLRSLPIISPVCRLPTRPGDIRPGAGAKAVTGTLFGYRKGRVNLSIQENPMTMPRLVLELDMQTNVLQKEMSLGMVRIALECEKKVDGDCELLDEPMWTMFCKGKKNGYVIKRDVLDEDLHVMEVLRGVSMGAGVLPGRFGGDEGEGGEIAYMRSKFELVVGSRDAETYYMLSPDGKDTPELSIFFVRI